MNYELENVQLKLRVIELTSTVLQYEHREASARLKELQSVPLPENYPTATDEIR